MLRRLIENYRKYRECRRTISKLSSLSDAELKDIGLNRGDIRRVAFNELD